VNTTIGAPISSQGAENEPGHLVSPVLDGNAEGSPCLQNL